MISGFGAFGCREGVPERIGSIYELKADPTEQNVQKIRKMLGDPERDVRATALNALVSLGTPDAGALALDGLGDSDGFVRATAAKLVGDVGNADHAGPLVRRLVEDSDRIVRQRAAEALARLGGAAAVEGLVRALEDPMENVRLAAVKGVRQLDPAAATPALARMLIDDPIWQIRVQAAKALGTVAGPEVRPPLEAALDDSNEFVRSAAANALRSQDRPGATPGETP